jgi:hypothetical protein
VTERDAWFAGLVDGEGCFTLSIYVQHRHALRFDLVFAISMKEGAWFSEAAQVLIIHDIRFSARRRKNQIEVHVEGHDRVKKLIRVLLPHLVVKRPLAQKLLSFPRAPTRNRFSTISGSYLSEICEIVDFVREFNRSKNRRHKWNSRSIKEFYGIG